jgi:hypothetical protein
MVFSVECTELASVKWLGKTPGETRRGGTRVGTLTRPVQFRSTRCTADKPTPPPLSLTHLISNMPRRPIQRSQSVASRFAERDARANHVPQFQSTIRFKHHFRYQAASQLTAFGITRGFLLNLLVSADGGGSPSTVASRLFSGVKINRIEIRCPGAAVAAGSDTTSLTTSLEWTSTYGPSSEQSDSGTPLHPPLLMTSPPPQSLASFWSLTGSNESDVLMLLTVPTQSIVDLWVDVVLMDGQTPVAVTLATSSTDGQVYALAMDGHTSNVLVPVSYSTTH